MPLKKVETGSLPLTGFEARLSLKSMALLSEMLWHVQEPVDFTVSDTEVFESSHHGLRR